MRKLRAFVVRFSAIFRTMRKREDEFAAEIESHVALHADEGMRAGLSAEEARRQALVRLGGVEQTRQRHRERRTLPWLECLMQDTRHGLRMMALNAGFTATAVLTLAIGIGASTAIFSAVKPILIDALPFPQASRLMMLWEARKDGAPMAVTFGSFHGLSERNHSFEALAAYKPWQPSGFLDQRRRSA